MKKKVKVWNGYLTEASIEEVKADVLSHMVVYVEGQNSFDNNKACPLNGEEYVDSFDDDIISFILGNDIKDWVRIPDEYVLDSIARQNFEHYIKWI